MTKRDWDKADEHRPDPARVLRDVRESRGERPLDDLIQFVLLYEPIATAWQQRLEAGDKLYPFELHRLEDWKRKRAEVARRQKS